MWRNNVGSGYTSRVNLYSFAYNSWLNHNFVGQTRMISLIKLIVRVYTYMLMLEEKKIITILHPMEFNKYFLLFRYNLDPFATDYRSFSKISF